MKRLFIRITNPVLSATIIALLFSVVSTTNSSAQIMKQVEADGFFMLPELGAAILQQHDTLRVDMMPPDEHKVKEYASVDLKVGDLVIMFNGKRLSSAKVLEDMYKALKPGDMIQLGIKRDEGLRIVKFVKADESKLPKRKMMIATDEGGGGQSQVQINSPEGMKSFSGEGLKLIPAAGLVVGMKEKHIEVIGVLPASPEKVSGGKIKEGDVITAFNGKAVTNTEELSTALEAIANGTKVALSLERKGTKLDVSFVKTEDKGQKIIKHEVK